MRRVPDHSRPNYASPPESGLVFSAPSSASPRLSVSLIARSVDPLAPSLDCWKSLMKRRDAETRRTAQRRQGLFAETAGGVVHAPRSLSYCKLNRAFFSRFASLARNRSARLSTSRPAPSACAWSGSPTTLLIVDLEQLQPWRGQRRSIRQCRIIMLCDESSGAAGTRGLPAGFVRPVGDGPRRQKRWREVDLLFPGPPRRGLPGRVVSEEREGESNRCAKKSAPENRG